jgi:hypothetical protein
LSKSQLPETKAKKKNRRTEAISKIVRESLWKNNNNATNGKKINNMKARLKKKTDKKKTANKRNKLCEWEKNCINVMDADADSNPALNKSPDM